MAWHRVATMGRLTDRAHLWLRVRRNGGKLQWPLRLPRPPGTDPVGQISVGERTFIGRNSWLEVANAQSRIRIGSEVLIGEDVNISAGTLVEIGDATIVAARTTIIDYTHDYRVWLRAALESGRRPRYDFSLTTPDPVRIGQGVWIAKGCVINPGVTIGDGCVIGANSVVTASVEPFTFAAGIPARAIRDLRAELQDPATEHAG